MPADQAHRAIDEVALRLRAPAAEPREPSARRQKRVAGHLVATDGKRSPAGSSREDHTLSGRPPTVA